MTRAGMEALLRGTVAYDVLEELDNQVARAAAARGPIWQALQHKPKLPTHSAGSFYTSHDCIRPGDFSKSKRPMSLCPIALWQESGRLLGRCGGRGMPRAPTLSGRHAGRWDPHI